MNNSLYTQLSLFEAPKEDFVKSKSSGEVFRLLEEHERHYLLESKMTKVPIRVLKDGFERVQDAE